MVAEFGPVTITHPPEVLENMDDWCKKMFAKNGLLKRIHSEGIPEKEAEMKVEKFWNLYSLHAPNLQNFSKKNFFFKIK